MGARGRERWVSPPVVGREPSSSVLGVWRFRLLLLVLLLLAALVAVKVGQHFSNTEQSPGIGLGPQPAASGTSTVAVAPPV